MAKQVQLFLNLISILDTTLDDVERIEKELKVWETILFYKKWPKEIPLFLYREKISHC